MKLEDFQTVRDLVSNRHDLSYQINCLQTRTTGYLGVTLSSKYQNDEMCDAVRPIVIHQLKIRLNAIDLSLVALGVQVTE